MLSTLSNALVLIGTLTFVIAGIGLIRLPDVCTRISAIGTAAGVGAACIVGGVALADPSWVNLVKGFIAIHLQLLTSVVGAMAIARAMVLSRHHFHRGTDIDDGVRLGVLDPPHRPEHREENEADR